MANQRMYLCFRPSGRLRFLGKHMASGYYMAPGAEVLDAYYAKCEEDWPCCDCDYKTGYGQDDFILLFETDDTWNIAPGLGDFAIANTPENPHKLPVKTPGSVTL